MRSPPPDDFEETFTPDVCDLLLEVVRSTYKLATLCFDSARPYSDANTFGTELYRFGGRKLTEAAEDRSNIIETVQEHPMFIHRVGKYELFCHRVGKRRGDDIWQSFPNPETEGVQRSSSLFLPGYEPDLSKIRNVVLAHIGNESIGLCGAYICMPVNNGDGNVTWGYVHTLYERPAQDVGSEVVVTPVAVEPAVDVAPAVVKRRRKKSGQ